MSVTISNYEGVGLVHAYGWDAEVARAVQTPGVRRVSLERIDSDLSFLAELPELDMLALTVVRPRDLSMVEQLAGVETLSLTLGRARVSPVDFSRVPGLRELGLDWNEGMVPISGIDALKALKVSRAPGPDLSFIGDLPTLELLWLTQSRRLERFDGLERYPRLRELKGYSLSALTSLQGVQRLRELRVLDLESCRKFEDIEAVGELRHLETLDISNCDDIASLEPLRNCQELRSLSAHSSTRVVDGDLSPIRDLPRLGELRMKHRREYTPSVDEIRERLA